MRRRPGAALLLLLMLVGACTVGPSTRGPLATYGAGPMPTASAAAPMPLGPGGPGRTSDPISWSTCPPELTTVDPVSRTAFVLQCGEVEVPKSYQDPGSGVLSIAVIRARTKGTPAGAPPLIVVRGDPGENGTHRIAAVAGSLPAQILDHFTVVGVDVRGTGDSSAIDCVSGQNSRSLLALGADPSTSVAATLVGQLSRSLTFDCGDMVGPQLSDYSSQPAADDLDTVRAALRVGKIDYLGQGFGATLGAVYADRYPGRVDRAVLDGPADPALAPDRQAAAAAAAQELALSSFASACQAFSGGCPLGADPVAEVKKLVATLGDTGVSSSPGQQITGGSVLLALAHGLGSPPSWPELARTLDAARRGNPDPLAGLLTAAPGETSVQEQQAAQLIYQCNDSGQRLGGPGLTKAAKAAGGSSPLFGPFLLGLVGICYSWPAPQTALAGVTAVGAPPLLVVGAVDDPVAPYSAVRSLSTGLASATLLSWQSGTHGAYPASTCVTAAVDTYLISGGVPAGGTLCPP